MVPFHGNSFRSLGHSGWCPSPMHVPWCKTRVTATRGKVPWWHDSVEHQLLSFFDKVEGAHSPHRGSAENRLFYCSMDFLGIGASPKQLPISGKLLSSPDFLQPGRCSTSSPPWTVRFSNEGLYFFRHQIYQSHCHHARDGPQDTKIGAFAIWGPGNMNWSP